MNTRKVLATLGIAGAITGGLALAAPANADRSGTVETDPGHVRTSLQGAWADGPMITARAANANGDPMVSMGADGTVRQADMADAHRPSMMAAPQTIADAFGKTWSKSFCYSGETSGHSGIGDGSERCRDAGR